MIAERLTSDQDGQDAEGYYRGMWYGGRRALTGDQAAKRRGCVLRLGRAGRLVAGDKRNRRHYRGSSYYCSRIIYLDAANKGQAVAVWEGWEKLWAEDWKRLQAGKVAGTSFLL